MPSLGNDMRHEAPRAHIVSRDFRPRGSSAWQSPLHFADGGVLSILQSVMNM